VSSGNGSFVPKKIKPFLNVASFKIIKAARNNCAVLFESLKVKLIDMKNSEFEIHPFNEVFYIESLLKKNTFNFK